MIVAVLEHSHRHGTDVKVALVDSRASMDNEEAIKKAMVKTYGIDFEKDRDETLELRLYGREEIKTIKIDLPAEIPEKNLRK